MVELSDAELGVINKIRASAAPDIQSVSSEKFAAKLRMDIYNMYQIVMDIVEICDDACDTIISDLEFKCKFGSYSDYDAYRIMVSDISKQLRDDISSYRSFIDPDGTKRIPKGTYVYGMDLGKETEIWKSDKGIIIFRGDAYKKGLITKPKLMKNGF